MELSERLLALRKQHGVSQEKLAEKLGVSRALIEKWENGEAVPSEYTVDKLSEYYDVAQGYILTGDESAEKIKRSKLWSHFHRHGMPVELAVVLDCIIVAFVSFFLLVTSLISVVVAFKVPISELPVFVIVLYFIVAAIFLASVAVAAHFFIKLKKEKQKQE